MTFPKRTRYAAAASLAGLTLASALLAAPAAMAAPEPSPTTLVGAVTELAPGLTHTSLDIGDQTRVYEWTVQITLPPDSDQVAAAPVSTEKVAAQVAQQLSSAGFDPRVEQVRSPLLADSGGDLGYRVRVGMYGTRAEAEDTRSALAARGFAGGTWYAGWDGTPTAGLPLNGPLNIDVLTVDPAHFGGAVRATFGTDLESTETTSAMAGDVLGAVNGGFFVYGAEHGAPGDPAGAGAYNGEILSEAVGDRPALIIDHRNGRARVERLTWEGALRSGGRSIGLDAINRVPGKIRNCGGTGDVPTDGPVHDATCTDDSEIVVITPEFGPLTPAGDGVELVIDAQGRPVDVRGSRGVRLEAGQRSIQATGAAAETLRVFAGNAHHVKVVNRFLNETGRVLTMTPHAQVINGGPMLLKDGEPHVTAARDGMTQPQNPGMFYGWVHQRNPRTIAGVDAEGRLVLATVDGRMTGSIGVSVAEAAELAKQLGLQEAINLDGGGSTTMVVDGELANTPSGGSERPVGDALVITGP